MEGDDIEENRHRLERMDQICVYCDALKWKGETKKFCCREGEIVLAPLAPAPASLHTLLTINDPNTNEPFVKSIRAYNSLFAFTSLGTTKVDKELADGRGGAYTFRLHGAMYHAIGGRTKIKNRHLHRFTFMIQIWRNNFNDETTSLLT